MGEPPTSEAQHRRAQRSTARNLPAADRETWIGNWKSLADANRLAEALTDYSRAIELKPNSPDFATPYNNRAVIYYEKKEYRKALADIEQFQKLGGKPSPQFLKDLSQAAGLGENGR